MKKFTALICILFSVMVVCGCGSVTAGKNFSTIATEFTQAMFDRDYAAAMTYVGEEYADSLNEDAMVDVVLGCQDSYGAFKKVTYAEDSDISTFLTEMGLDSYYSASDFPFAVAYAEVAFEENDMGIYYLFDPSDRSICSMTVCGMEAKEGMEEDGDTVTEQDYINDINANNDSPYK